MTRQELTVLLRHLRAVAGSDIALARQLGVSSNHIPRLLDQSGAIQPTVETCLRIAQASGRMPTEILEAAGHGGVAPLLEAAYRPGPKVEIETLPALPFQPVRLMASPIAAGTPLVITGEVADYLAFREKFVRQFVDPIAFRVGKKEDSMVPTILPNDVVVLDQDPAKRMNPRRERIYALNVPGGDLSGGTLKRVRTKRGALIVIPENPRHDPDLIDLKRRPLTEIIVGECVWIGRYLEETRGR